MNVRKLCVLGATGSIGQSTLDVASRHPDKFDVIALSANTNVDKLFEQCVAFLPKVAVMACERSAIKLREKLARAKLPQIDVLFGEQAIIDIASSKTSDTVMAAIVGASGLMPTLSAVQQGKRVLLANKEALVTSGQIFIDAVKLSGAELLPIDSEHNAIFQCLPESEQRRQGFCELADKGISKILLTGSGGPFRSTPLADLERVTPEQACKHPNWDMGRKISVDSATMMNKGLEFIEAKWLFNVKPEQIQVVLHPQSTIHSMVQYKDGSVIAQMGNPDMRTPIAHAMAYPDRIESGVEPLDFFNVASFDFSSADVERYPNLALAIKACGLGQGACTSLNAANEIAVEAFLNKEIKFTDIAIVNEKTVNSFSSQQILTIDDVITLDSESRNYANNIVNSLKAGELC